MDSSHSQLTSLPDQMDYAVMLRKMLARSKQQNESLLQYFYDKLSLLEQLEIDGANAVSCIIDGLPDDQGIMASAGNYMTPADLYKFLDCMDIYPPQLICSLCGLNGHCGERCPQRNKPKASQEKNTGFKKSRSLGNMKCYRCMESGHRARQCPQKNKAQKPQIKGSRTDASNSTECFISQTMVTNIHQDSSMKIKEESCMIKRSRTDASNSTECFISQTTVTNIHQESSMKIKEESCMNPSQLHVSNSKEPGSMNCDNSSPDTPSKLTTQIIHPVESPPPSSVDPTNLSATEPTSIDTITRTDLADLFQKQPILRQWPLEFRTEARKLRPDRIPSKSQYRARAKASNGKNVFFNIPFDLV